MSVSALSVSIPSPASALQGRWLIVSAAFAGQPMAAASYDGGMLEVVGHTLQVRLPQCSYRAQLFWPDPDDRAAMNVGFIDGPNAGLTAKGLMAVQGDEWRICLGFPGALRPLSLEAGGDDACVLQVLRRLTRAETRSIANTRRTWRQWLASAALVGLMTQSPLQAGEVTEVNGMNVFRESFRWQGNHAATINAGSGNTVWWPESEWDARGDSAFISTQALEGDNGPMSNRFHIDIHKAASADPPHSAALNNSSAVVNGDGSPGVGIMHLDYQDIVSARLRNPLLISPSQSGTVRFYAPLYVTTGHWWEIAITPADQIVGGEHTGVPSVNSPLPFPGGLAANPGPGHSQHADSINLIAIGSADAPCAGSGGPGFRTRFGVSKTVAFAETHYITESATQQSYLPTGPEQLLTLVEWSVEFAVDHVALSADLDGDGQLNEIERWPVSVPWPEVHVHLLGVAYQSDHHPQAQCVPVAERPTMHLRELAWRDVRVWPVRYTSTDVYPKNQGTAQLIRSTGYTEFDLRDIQRFGVVNGVPQANPDSAQPYSVNHPGRYCRDAGFPCFGNVSTQTLPLPLTSTQRQHLVAARLLADLKDAATAGARPSVQVAINNQSIGRLPEHDAVLPDADWGEWVRRALPVPVAGLQASNSLQLSLEQGAYVDRIELELLYDASANQVFKDGFEPSVVGLNLKPAGKRQEPKGLRFPIVPFTEIHHCSF